jgi:hypothetical protein
VSKRDKLELGSKHHGSKKGTEALKKIRSDNNSRNYNQGIGIHLPPNVPLKEYQKLKKKWDKILEAAGHDEIEQFSTNCTGHFSPFFIKSKHNRSLSGSSATVARTYKPDTEEYYRRLGLFYHHANFHNLFRGKSRLYKRLVMLLKDGATYQNLVDYIKSERAPKSIRAKKSIFWAHYHVKILEAKMAEWFIETNFLYEE